MRIEGHRKFFAWIDDLDPIGFVKYINNLYPEAKWNEGQVFDVNHLLYEYARFNMNEKELNPFCIMYIGDSFSWMDIPYILKRFNSCINNIFYINKAVYKFTQDILDT